VENDAFDLDFQEGEFFSAVQKLNLKWFWKDGLPYDSPNNFKSFEKSGRELSSVSHEGSINRNVLD